MAGLCARMTRKHAVHIAKGEEGDSMTALAKLSGGLHINRSSDATIFSLNCFYAK